MRQGSQPPARVPWRRKLGLGLLGKFVLSISLLMVASSTSLGWFLLKYVKEIAVEDIMEQGVYLGRNIADECELGVLTENGTLLEEVLSQALENENVIHAMVRDSDGRVLAEQKSFPFLPSLSGAPEGSLRTWKDPRDRPVAVGRRYSEVLFTDLFDFTIPVLTLRGRDVGEEIGFLFEEGSQQEREWETVGWVTLSLSFAKADHQARLLARGVLLWTLGILAVGILLIYWLVRIIVEPTKRLVQATQRITGGDLTSLVEVRSRDEIGDLAVSFNQMTVELKRSRDALEDYSASLEAKVRERTRELEEIQRQLIQAEKLSAVGQLVSGVAHELNNPLAGILGYSQLLLKGSCEGQYRRGLERIEREAQRCKKTVQNLQVFARKHQPQKKLISIHAVLESTLELRVYQLSVDDIRVVRRYDENLPSTMADFHQLQQVFLNVIVNAHQAMKGIGRKGILILETKRRGDRILVTIADNGRGIPPEHLSKIFDPFFTTKEVGQGTGLGLSICFGIIKAHRGEIQVRSELGKGTTFSIEIPILADLSQDSADSEPRAHRNRGEGKGSAILVVDDEPTITEVLTEALALDGHRVDTARNGKAALEKIARNGFEVIITDLRMPGMGGEEFYRQVKLRSEKLARRIIFSTGDVASESTRRFLEESGNLHLQKPFEISAIRKLVQQVLKGARGPDGPSDPD